MSRRPPQTPFETPRSNRHDVRRRRLSLMPRRHVVLALVVAVCWAVNFVVIDIGLESFPPLLFAALRFGLTALPAIFFVPRPDERWRAVVAVGLFIGVGQFGVLFVAMKHRAAGRACVG